MWDLNKNREIDTLWYPSQLTSVKFFCKTGFRVYSIPRKYMKDFSKEKYITRFVNESNRNMNMIQYSGLPDHEESEVIFMFFMTFNTYDLNEMLHLMKNGVNRDTRIDP